MARARSKPVIDQNRLIKILKGGETKHSAVASRLGVEPGQLDMMTFNKAKLAAGVIKKAPATSQSVRKLRDQDKARWEEVAVRTGLSIAAAKEEYEAAGGDSSARVNAAEDDGTTTPRRGSGKRSSAKRGAAKRSPAKRAAAKRGAAKRAATPRRARTLAERRRGSSENPS